MVDSSGTENPQDHGLSEEQAQRIAARYQLSPAQFRQLDEQRQQRILLRLLFHDLPQQRASFFAQFHRGDDGEIAPDGFRQAADRLIEMRANTPAALRGRIAGMSVGPLGPTPSSLLEHMAGLAPDNTGWTWLGPGNIGGRIRSIVITPSTPRKIYVGSVSGGIWTSTDSGASWQPVDDLMANLAVCSMAMVPAPPPPETLTIYAGTGEGYLPDGAPKNDEIQGNGIFKTTDGRIWQQLPSTKATPTNQDFLKVNGIAVSRNGGVVLAGTRTGIFRSTDKGGTWTKVLPVTAPPPAPPPPPAIIGNILFDPNNDNNCIAGLLQGGGIYFSTNGGATWTQSTYPAGTPLTGRIQVCYAKKDSTVYASVETFQSGVRGSQIWRSSNGGALFTKKGNPLNYLGEQGWYNNIIWAGDNQDSNFLIVGGVDLYKSPDGGDTISAISSGLNSPPSAHADHHVIVADPDYNGTPSNSIVYFGNDGGLYRADNVKEVSQLIGWTNLNSKLPITQFYSVSGKVSTGGAITSIVGGAQDTGTLRYTPAAGANAWNMWFGGDGGTVASDWTAGSNYYYGEYVYLQIFRSTDGGVGGQYICGLRPDGTWKADRYRILDAQDAGKALFIAPFILDPSSAKCLIAGGSSLWQTLDATVTNDQDTGPIWSAIKPPLPPPYDKAKISAIAKLANFAQMLVGYSNGQIYKSDDLPLWDRIDSAIGANRMCTSLVIDTRDANRFYATFGGFQTNNIWTSWNAGTNWRSLGGTLPPAPIYCVAIHPQNSDWLYLGTETGIFASEDGGLTWAPNNEGPTNCLVYQLTWLGNTLCCASHGRGVFAIDLTIRQQASYILAGDTTGTLRAFDQNGGVISSYQQTSSQIICQPLVDGANVYAAFANVAGQYPGVVAKFARASALGSTEWTTSFTGSVNVTPCLVKAIYPGDPDVLYVFGSDGQLSAVNASTGFPLWGLQVVPTPQVGAGVIAYSNQFMNQWIYIAANTGLYAVDIQARSVVWSKSYGCTAPPLLVSNTVVVPARDGKIYSVHARTGNETWPSAYAISNVRAAPVWVQGSIIVGNQAGQLVGIDYATGTQQFTLPFPNEQILAIAADGNEIYFTGNAANGHLYAYELNVTTRVLSPKWGANLAIGSSGPPQIVGSSLYLTAPTGGTAATGTLQAFTTGGAFRWSRTFAGIAQGAPALVYT